MKLDECIGRLNQNAVVFRGLAEGVALEQAVWKPATGRWSILEVVNHLDDEEREDFKLRLEYTLERPEAPWPPIDPEGWAVERDYNSRDLGESLARFLDERASSTEWLSGLQSAAWHNRYEHPLAGEMSAGELLVSWVLHDLLHIHQLTRLHWEFARKEVGTAAGKYAGEWP